MNTIANIFVFGFLALTLLNLLTCGVAVVLFGPGTAALKPLWNSTKALAGAFVWICIIFGGLDILRFYN